MAMNNVGVLVPVLALAILAAIFYVDQYQLKFSLAKYDLNAGLD